MTILDIPICLDINIVLLNQTRITYKQGFIIIEIKIKQSVYETNDDRYEICNDYYEPKI